MPFDTGIDIIKDTIKGGTMAGFLTTHVLDTALGRPAAGMRITLYALDGQTESDTGDDEAGGRRQLAEVTTNADGRTDGPILPEARFRTGRYELIFHVGEWLDATGHQAAQPRFLDEVPIRFGMSEDDHYHVPLLISPYGFSTYRGS